MSKKTLILVLIVVLSTAVVSFSSQMVGACGMVGVTTSPNPC
jgi:hypothetical protein